MVYLVAVFLGGALAAPWFYHGVHALAEAIPTLQPVADHPFSRYLNRTWLLFAIAGLWPLLRGCQMNARPALGLAHPGREWPRLVAGLLVALALAVGVFALAWMINLRGLHSGRSWSEFGARLLKAGQAAAFVSVIEEVLFRGALFGILRKSVSWSTALGLSSAFYAWVHFLRSVTEPATVDWASGLTILIQVLSSSWAAILTPTFLNLALAGAILGFCYEWTGSLYFSIGLHAGGILGLKVGSFLTQPGAETSGAFWGSGRILDGWLVALILGIVLALCLRLPRPGPRTEDTSWQRPAETG